MGSIFSTETDIYQKLNKYATVLLCGFTWLICCIPVITVGAACTAMYRMMFNIREDKPAGFAAFFRVFAKEFPKSTVIWLCDLVCIFLLYLILCAAAPAGIEDAKGIASMFLFLLPFLVWMFTFLYVFALNAFFENTVLHTIRNGLLMSLKYYRYSICALALTMIPFFIYSVIGGYYFLFGVPIFIFVLLPLVFYWNSGIFMKVFRNYIPEDSNGSEEAPENR